jgi:hypothetical protein
LGFVLEDTCLDDLYTDVVQAFVEPADGAHSGAAIEVLGPEVLV